MEDVVLKISPSSNISMSRIFRMAGEAAKAGNATVALKWHGDTILFHASSDWQEILNDQIKAYKDK